MKKILCLSAVCVICAVMLAACGNKDDGAAVQVGEPQTQAQPGTQDTATAAEGTQTPTDNASPPDDAVNGSTPTEPAETEAKADKTETAANTKEPATTANSTTNLKPAAAATAKPGNKQKSASTETYLGGAAIDLDALDDTNDRIDISNDLK